MREVARYELDRIVIPDRAELVQLYHDIADAVADSGNIAELTEKLRSLWQENRLPLTKQALGELIRSLSGLVEEWGDPEYGWTLLGPNRVFARALQLAGYPAFELDRAVAVAVPGKVIYRLRLTGGHGPAELDEHTRTDRAVALLVFADPDSGIRGVDEVVITGYRFGADAVIKNGQTLVEVHGDSLDEARAHAKYLGLMLDTLTLKRAGESDEETQQRRAKVAKLKECLRSVLDFLETEARKGWL